MFAKIKKLIIFPAQNLKALRQTLKPLWWKQEFTVWGWGRFFPPGISTLGRKKNYYFFTPRKL